jgi:hypothetical protein
MRSFGLLNKGEEMRWAGHVAHVDEREKHSDFWW